MRFQYRRPRLRRPRRAMVAPCPRHVKREKPWVRAGGHTLAPLAMAVEIDPQRGDSVQVAAPVGVFQMDTPAPFDDEGRLLLPLTLLGEGMPEAAAILRLKPRGAGRGSHAVGPL